MVYNTTYNPGRVTMERNKKYSWFPHSDESSPQVGEYGKK
jgi:hypothetical protein